MKLFRRVTLLVLSLLVSCEADKAILPTYLVMPEAILQAGTEQGDNTHLISELWVFVDSVAAGAFPLPARVPIIEEKSVTVEIFAGIRENGQAVSPIIYPFYRSVTVPVDHVPLSADAFTPTFTYKGNAIFALVETFDGGHALREDLDGDAETFVEISDEGGLRGQAGRALLSANLPTLEVASRPAMRGLPVNGSAVYLELDYRSAVPLSVGLRGWDEGADPVSQYKLVLFPSEEWQKVYVHFSEELQASQLQNYQVIFLASFDASLPDQNQELFLDNIKVLHF